MCGRYSLEATAEDIVEAFGLLDSIALAPRYNIAPTQNAPVIRLDPGQRRRLDLIRWGLVPGRAGSLRALINARSESVADKPSFRDAFRHRRCLIPATGFFEWQKLGGAKQPFHITRRDRAVLAFAGVWELSAGSDGKTIETFAILTTSPNRTMTPIHDRMPVILDPTRYDLWLDAGIRTAEPLRHLMTPAPDELIQAYPVSTRVNSPDNDDPTCVRPMTGESPGLFDNA